MPDSDVLIQHYLEGRLNESEAAELHALLQANPKLGEQLLGQFELDAMLRASREALATKSNPVVLLPARRFSFATMAGVAAMAACITMMATWWLMNLQSTDDEATTAAVAVLTRGVNLEWEAGTTAHAPGAALSPGWLKLKSGLAQIEFYQGARVLVEGPAAIRLQSSGEAECTSGKLMAQVPEQAHGFRINTPKGSVTDLGTEFGLNIKDNNAEVHVFKGSVAVQASGSDRQVLTEGDALVLAAATQRGVADANVFASLTELDARTAASQRIQFERWQQLNAQRNDDPALRLRLDFQDMDEARSLQNHAANRQGVPDASIVGCSWIEGRWPGKRALDFRTVSDRVRLSVPGTYPALTMAAWVRVSGLDRSYNSLFMCEGWGDRKVHWQITHEGKIRLGLASDRTLNARFNDCDSPPLFTPERFGRWTHLAVIFDAEHRVVRHYVDGKVVATVATSDTAPARLGVAELGNWNRSGPGATAMRNLSGAMDEFALYTRALSDHEIAVLAK